VDRLIFIFLACFNIICIEALAQTIRIIDAETGKPVELVQVNHTLNDQIQLSDRDGIIHLSGNSNNDTVSISHSSYESKTIPVNRLNKPLNIIPLNAKTIAIGEVVVSANKWEQDQREIPQKIIAIGPAEISFSSPRTSADLLENTGGIFMQRSQLGGGSPMIRGFAANSLLIVVDGVRMNNAIYRSGNLQNIISLDPAALEGAEIIFGPGSVIYGSDALGGVMDFHTLQPQFSKDFKLQGRTFSRFSSATSEKTAHLDFNLQWEKFSSLTNFTIADFGDLRVGSDFNSKYPDFGKRPFYVAKINGRDSVVNNPDPLIQRFSGYRQLNLMQKFSYLTGDSTKFTYAFHYSNTSDIPRFDRLTETTVDGLPVFASWSYGPQKWMMNQLQGNFDRNSTFFDQARINLAFQNVTESRIDRRFRSEGERTQLEKVNAINLNFDANLDFNTNFQIFYGIELLWNRVNSSAWRTNIQTGATEKTGTRYPDGGSDYYSGAAYVSSKIKLNSKLLLNSGLRYSQIGLQSEIREQLPFEENLQYFELNNGAFNGSLGLVYEAGKNFLLNFTTSSGFRAPNVDDVGKLFEFSDGILVVPNPNLKPEYSYNLEFSIRKHFGDKIYFESAVYYTFLRNAMVRRPFSLYGKDTLEIEGDTKVVTAVVNAGRGFIVGFESRLHLELSSGLWLETSLNWTEGQDLENIPLRHIPPLFGQTNLSFKKNRLHLEFSAKYNGSKPFSDLPPEEQVKENIYTPEGSLSWYTLNIYGSYRINYALRILGSIENILDQHYRPFSSGISAPGRNVSFTLEATLW
jgi:hemoglobin/transferrin/lactoferrin receptor protein